MGESVDKTVMFHHLPELVARGEYPVLSDEEAVRGADAAVLSARSLLEDAKLLFGLQRWPRSASIAVLAMEEFGKFHMLLAVHQSKTDEDRKSAWRNYYNHPAKAGMSIGPAEIRSMTAAELHAWRVENGKRFDHVKQLGFYSGLTPGREWIRPSQSITQKDAGLMITFAEYNISQLNDWESKIWRILPADRR